MLCHPLVRLGKESSLETRIKSGIVMWSNVMSLACLCITCQRRYEQHLRVLHICHCLLMAVWQSISTSSIDRASYCFVFWGIVLYFLFTQGAKVDNDNVWQRAGPSWWALHKSTFFLPTRNKRGIQRQVIREIHIDVSSWAKWGHKRTFWRECGELWAWSLGV